MAKNRISQLIINKLFGNASGKNYSGFAFKSNTNDIRNSPAIDICEDLLEEGSHLAIYDPKVTHYKLILCLNKKLND